jgi:protein TonB
MSYKVLLFSADEKAVRLLTQILSELEFTAELSSDPFTAVKTLTELRFDALIVDCDHEQNAALLFKSARNSELNQSSLGIALVQGQATIAKAFRLGANLVLTKPINSEQCKGTLRTARGLLRKAENSQAGTSSKTSGTSEAPSNFNSLDFSSPNSSSPNSSSSTFSASGEPAAPLAPAFASSAPASSEKVFAADMAPVASLQLELEKEPAPKPDAADAALLESLPKPLPVQPAPSPAISLSSKGYAWQTASKAADLGALAPQSSSSGAATAAAPAKLSAAQPARDNFALYLEEAEAAPAQATADSKKPAAGKDFSWSAAAQQQDASEEAARKRNFLIAAAIVLGLAAGLYFTWPRLQGLLSHSPISSAPIVAQQPAPTAPASTPSSVQSATSDPNNGTVAGSPLTQNPGAPGASDTTPTAADRPAGTTEPVSGGSGNKVAIPAANASSGGTDLSPGGVAPGNSAATGLPAPRISERVSSGLLLEKVEPVYPAAAKQTQAQGTVQLEADISKDGRVSDVKVLSGRPMFAAAAVEAVKQWKYKPYLLNGDAVDIRTFITVQFKPPQDAAKN